MNRRIYLVPFVVLGLIALAIILHRFPHDSLHGGIFLNTTPTEVIDRSRILLEEEGIHPHALNSEVQFSTDRKLIRQVQTMFGLEEGNRLLRESVPAHRWVAKWTKRSPVRFTFEGESDTETLDDVDAWLKGEVRVSYDQNGNLVRYTREIPDSLALQTVSADSALSIVQRFVSTHAPASRTVNGSTLLDVMTVSSEVPRRIEMRNRHDYSFESTLKDSLTGDHVKVSWRVSGPHVSRIEISYDVPAAYNATGTHTVSTITEIVLIVVLLIIMVVVSFKRFRAYEIGFRIAIIMGMVSAFGISLSLMRDMGSTAGWEILIPLVFAILFVGGGALIVWAASESVVREAWKEKIVTLDLLSKGYVLHSRIGQSVVRGLSLGLVALAMQLVVTWALGGITRFGLATTEDGLYTFVTSGSPALSAMFEGIYKQIFTIAIFFMFLASWLIKKTGRAIWTGAIVVAVLVFMKAVDIEPIWAGIAMFTLPMAVAVFAVIRYDILTAFLVLIAASAAQSAAILYASPLPVYAEETWIVGGILGCAVLAGLLVQFRREEVTDFDGIAPVYARHITERERLRHELEIARNVQMSFLPKRNPVIRSLDIASRCAPALEVGGDYYDFMEFEDGRLGVTVGDVSGKGTQAAFFMTLTKGFLRAVSRATQSPARILSEVNKLFYENVERGIFISMIYGMFDTHKNRLTIARAGHNPVILRKSVERDTQVLNPMGLALGLDPGEVFGQSLKEVSVTYAQGDVFVFYTDGISEAMNTLREEYGEPRLASSIEHHAHKSAAEILEGIVKDMHTFVGKAEQHDDVTLVVVKIS